MPDVRGCSVAGQLSAGGICAHSNYESTEDLTFDQFLSFIEADQTTGKGAAVCYSAEDVAKMKTAMETMCRMLGKQCTYETISQGPK